jgi:hypothetical protein
MSRFSIRVSEKRGYVAPLHGVDGRHRWNPTPRAGIVAMSNAISAAP